MELEERIRAHFVESIALKEQSLEVLAPGIALAAERMAASLAQGGRIFCCGNGGSAADAQHFASELVGRFEAERDGLAALALATDGATLSSIANDYGYEEVFARQLRAQARTGDLLLAISTSGRSPNVVRAVEAARKLSVPVVALTGRTGDALAAALGPQDLELRVPHERTARIQEVHGLIVHCLCDGIDALRASA